jgi:DNA recombination protein RmuC
MDLFIVILGFITVALLAFIIFKDSSKNGGENVVNEDNIINQILLKTTQNQGDFIDRIIDKLNQNQTKSLEQLNTFENKISSGIEAQKQDQKLEFEKLKNANQEGLTKIQTEVQERLSKAISDLVQLNNKNFELLSKTNQERLDQINQDVQKRLDQNFQENMKSFKQVSENLGHIQATAGKMIESTKSVDKLNLIFARTSSKAFGDFGEKYLESLLREHLAQNSWGAQVTIPRSQDKIDFVINVDNKKIGIDSKFPVTRFQDYLEAEASEKTNKLKEYLRAILQMATEISNKYYRNSFLDTLFLYLPSDSMYNEAVNNAKMLESLTKLKVTLCSPTTIFPLIMLIQTYQFKLNVNERAEDIIKGLKGIRQNVEGFKEEFRKLGDKIRQAQDNYDKADRNLIGVDKNILVLEAGSQSPDDETAIL